MQERDELRALKREINMLGEREVKKKEKNVYGKERKRKRKRKKRKNGEKKEKGMARKI
jgi:hypothetical protein